MTHKKGLKKALSLILTLALLLPAASAAIPLEYSEPSAWVLHELGLFQGVGDNADGTPNFALEHTPTRHEAVTMLVRLLGKESAALNGTWDTPFEDVEEWAEPYVGYAYTNKLTFGISDTEFAGQDAVTATQYLTFVLRALGYQSGADFQWDSAWVLSDELGFTFGHFSENTADFNRGDVACISEYALYTSMKTGGKTLLQYLKDAGALAETNLVMLDTYIPTEAFSEDTMSLVVYAIPGSPQTYTSLRVNSVRLNGVRATVKMQYTTNKAVLAAFSGLRETHPTAINRVQLNYNLGSVIAASSQSIHNNFPYIDVSMECTAVNEAGKSVNFTYTYGFYLDTANVDLQ